MNQTYFITLRIQRFDPDTGRSWKQSYPLEVGRIQRFVDVFRKINEDHDATLAWNSSCEHGQCGTCTVVVNGKPLLACELLVENAVDFFQTTTFDVAPIPIAPVIRDLIVDLDVAYERINRVKPYIIRATASNKEGVSAIVNDEQEFYVSATRCINCFCCVSACISSHDTFLGPNAMLASIVRLMDKRESEKEERKKVLFSDVGLYRCHSSKACSFVCPKEIDVAHFIALAKKGQFTREA